MSFSKKLSRLVVVVCLGLLMGCAATHTALNKRSLEVQTKMSATVFLDPVAPDKRTVYVQVRNTSDAEAFDIQPAVMAAVVSKGYQVVDNPEKAHYLLQANVLQVGRTDLRAAQHALDQGYGAAVSGAVIGAAAGAMSSSDNAVLAGGLLGAAVSTVTDAMVKDVSFSVITDVQISERVGKTTSVREKTRSKLKQGTSGAKEVTSIESVKWKRYQTRIVSTANKVNLQLKSAEPELVAGITRSIVGVF